MTTLRFNSRPQDGDVGYYNESGYAGPGPFWAQWRTIAPDLSKVSISKVHIAKAGDDLHALCGKEIQIENGTLIQPTETGHCERCKSAWAKGRR
jgi:hypothetical protein